MLFLSNIELLFYVSNRIEKDKIFKQHKHDFWQAEILNSGKARAQINKKTIELNAKDILFIPPGTSHGFKYIEESEVINMRFSFTHDINLADQKFRFDKVISDDNIASFLWEYPEDGSLLTQTENIILRHMLCGLFCIYYNKQKYQQKNMIDIL